MAEIRPLITQCVVLGASLLSLLLWVSCRHTAVAPRSVDEAAIRRVIAAYVDAWNANDMDAWGRLFTDDADYVNRNGGWWKSNADNVAGHRRIHDSLRRMRAPMDFAATVESIELLAPDIALVHVTTRWPGISHAPGRGAVASDGIITAVLVKRDGRWLIRAFHNTLVLEPGKVD